METNDWDLIKNIRGGYIDPTKWNCKYGRIVHKNSIRSRAVECCELIVVNWKTF